MTENASSVLSLSDGKKKSALREQVSIFFSRKPRVFVSSKYFFLLVLPKTQILFVDITPS